jgi:hypothetical protein
MKNKNEMLNIPLTRQKLYQFVIEQGKVISRMIRIFLAIRHMLPEGPREQIEAIAKQWALDNDKDRGSVHSPGSLNFLDEGWNIDKKTRIAKFKKRKSKPPRRLSGVP